MINEMMRSSLLLLFSLQEIMKLNDLDENGCLTFDEFLMAMPGNKEISRNDHRLVIPANKIYSPIAGSMLGQRRRRWLSIETTLRHKG